MGMWYFSRLDNCRAFLVMAYTHAYYSRHAWIEQTQRSADRAPWVVRFRELLAENRAKNL